MKERPIIFSGPMVRAILEGRKTQTRRIVKPQPPNHSWSVLSGYKLHAHVDVTDVKNGLRFHHSVERQNAKDSLHQDESWIACPLGKPGDRLWVKESWRLFDSSTECACYDYCDCSRFHGKPLYKASHDDLGGPWKPSIYMPRDLSRITLEITDVRVERLQSISHTDIECEGVENLVEANWSDGSPCEANLGAWQKLWESINGPASWAENPWVWVYSFERLDI